MLKWTLIALGGGLGSVLRYALASWVQKLSGVHFPTGTLAVNVIGCLVIGLLSGIFAGSPGIREEYRLGLTVGILGGFTTFSTFGLDTYHLAYDGQLRWAAANLLLSCGLGLAGVWLGFRIATRW